MQTGWNENRAILQGTVAGAPSFSHENHGNRYDTFPLVIQRLSGAEDRINVVAPQQMLEQCSVRAGAHLAVEGEIRSFNNKTGRGSRLIITLYAKKMENTDGIHTNDLIVAGVLCKPPIFRRTPLGREICDLMLAVNRRYGRADYLPCIAWGAMAQKCGALLVGDGIHIQGRFQSRDYTKVENGENQIRTAYEISVMRMEKVDSDGKAIE